MTKRKVKLTDKNKYDENISTYEGREILNALIIDNLPYCPICKTRDKLSPISSSYEVVKLNNNNVILFKCSCNKCRVDIQYCSDTTLERTVRMKSEGIEKIKKEE